MNLSLKIAGYACALALIFGCVSFQEVAAQQDSLTAKSGRTFIGPIQDYSTGENISIMDSQIGEVCLLWTQIEDIRWDGVTNAKEYFEAGMASQRLMEQQAAEGKDTTKSRRDVMDQLSQIKRQADQLPTTLEHQYYKKSMEILLSLVEAPAPAEGEEAIPEERRKRAQLLKELRENAQEAK